MTTNFTMFVNLSLQAFPDYVTDVDTSTFAAQLDEQVRYNIQDVLISQEVYLNSGGSYQPTIPGLSATQWYLIAVTSVGSPLITTPATIVNTAIAGSGYLTVPTNNLTSGSGQTARVPIYGATMASAVTCPGIVYLSIKGLTAAPTINSTADGSIFQVFIATCVEDGG